MNTIETDILMSSLEEHARLRERLVIEALRLTPEDVARIQVLVERGDWLDIAHWVSGLVEDALGAELESAKQQAGLRAIVANDPARRKV